MTSNKDLAVDPTTTAAWESLEELAAGFTPNLRKWFGEDAKRATAYTYEAADLHVDLSKNLVTQDVLELLLQLAEQTGLTKRRAAIAMPFCKPPSQSRTTCPRCKSSRQMTAKGLGLSGQAASHPKA